MRFRQAGIDFRSWGNDFLFQHSLVIQRPLPYVLRPAPSLHASGMSPTTPNGHGEAGGVGQDSCLWAFDTQQASCHRRLSQEVLMGGRQNLAALQQPRLRVCVIV